MMRPRSMANTMCTAHATRWHIGWAGAASEHLSQAAVARRPCQTDDGGATGIALAFSRLPESPRSYGAAEDQPVIEFRWVALIALWTMLIGPILDQSAPTPRGAAAHSHAASKAKR